MDLPALNELHKKALEKLRLIQEGNGPDGFAALVDTARYFAIADVCAAIHKDFRTDTARE